MPDDAPWYEAAFVVGMTNALNVVADALAPQPGVTLLMPVEETCTETKVASVFAEIREFYARQDVPLPFQFMAHDPGYLADMWQAVQRAFREQRLTRRLKESLAFAVSVTTRSTFGTAFHLAEMRRLGVSERGVMEVLGVTQVFSSYTKIADTLRLEPDMAQMAPVDWSPAPGGPDR
jgi:AhpD family alkylhydroperoxidase